MRGVLIGIAVGVALVVGGVVALVTLYSGPELSVQGSAPEAVNSGQPFRVRLQVFNPHEEVVTLDSIDVDNSVFDTFEVLSVTPAPTSDSPSAIIGQKSWSFLRDIDPEQQQAVEFELVSEERERSSSRLMSAIPIKTARGTSCLSGSTLTESSDPRCGQSIHLPILPPGV